jgi:ABC-type glucose/galactose transport system permease subunit
VRYLVTATGGNPATFALSGSRVTLLLAAVIVIAAAFYASRAIDWRAKRARGEAHDA